jgi:hypothetical protein
MTGRILTPAVLLALAVAPVSAQEKYEVKLRKPVKGDTLLIEKRDTETSKTVILDNTDKALKEIDQPKQSSHYAYREEILQEGTVGSKPAALKRHYNRALTTTGETPTVLAIEGKTVLIEKKGDKYRFQIEGGAELTGKDAEQLDKEFNKGNVDFDKLLMPGRPVAVGETWKIDTGPLLEDLKRSGEFVVDPAKFQATAKLLKAYKQDGRQFGVLRVELVMPIKSIKSGGKDVELSAGSKAVLSGDMDVCIDGSAGAGTLAGNMSFDLTFPLPDQPQLRATVQMRGTMFDQRKLPK